MNGHTSLLHQFDTDPIAFWKSQGEKIDWYHPPTTTIHYVDEYEYHWYSDGQLNTSYLCIDKHIKEGQGEKVAIIYDSPVTNKKSKITYNELHEKVSKFANVLKTNHVNKGDTVIIYLPMIPEAIYAMLACARIGAIHSVVFGGFAPHELAIRINDAKPKIIITASCGIEINKVIPYYPLVATAILESHEETVPVMLIQRPEHEAISLAADVIDYHSAMDSAVQEPCTTLKATDPLYILYTSGTTGKPKGIVRDNGGHAVALRFSMEYIYDISIDDVFWAASDVGWVVGHSYIVYAPLMMGCTTVLYEGKPIKTPDASAFWRMIDEYKVNVLFTAPTGIRAIKKEDPHGEFIKQYDLSSLRRLYLAGERCDVSTLEWASDALHVPVIDHWWQTETGWPIVAQMPKVNPSFTIKPGSAGLPIPGYVVKILDEHGSEQECHLEGHIALQLPLPPGCLPTLFNDKERYIESYLSKFVGYYNTGDGGYVDEEGYVFIMGRVDDVINVSGHRLSTGEMEEIISSHAAVAECAVVGVYDDLKGQVPMAFVVLKDSNQEKEEDVSTALKNLIREMIGAIASLKDAHVVKRLPKTRSGKILRRLLRNIADKQHIFVPSTIEDADVIQEIKEIFI